MLSLSQAPVKWEPVDVTPILKDGKTAIPDDAIKSVKKNYVALKGPLAVRFLSYRDLLLRLRNTEQFLF